MPDDLSNAFGAVKRDAVRDARTDTSRNSAAGARAGATAAGAAGSASSPTTFTTLDGKTLHPFTLDGDDLVASGDEATAYLW